MLFYFYIKIVSPLLQFYKLFLLLQFILLFRLQLPHYLSTHFLSFTLSIALPIIFFLKFHCLLLFYYCGTTLPNRALFLNVTLIQDRYIGLHEIRLELEIPVHHKCLIPMLEVKKLMAILTGKLSTSQEMYVSD